MILGGDRGISFHTYGEKRGDSRFFVPKEIFTEYFIDPVEDNEDLNNGFCIDFCIFLDFLHLSLIRGNRLIELTSWHDLDFINLRYICT